MESNKRMGTESNKEWEWEVTEGQAWKVRTEQKEEDLVK